jgi:protease PrsW
VINKPQREQSSAGLAYLPKYAVKMDITLELCYNISSGNTSPHKYKNTQKQTHMVAIAYIALGLLPGAFWLWYYRQHDKERPEPLRFVIKIFLLGMLITIPAAALELGAERIFPFSQSTSIAVILASTLFIVAPIEELLKFFIVKRYVYDRGKFDEAFDGMIYAIVVALGFASLENILAAFSRGLDALALRFITATLLHALTAGIMGYFLGLAKYNPKQERLLIAQGIISAIVLHGLYNFILVTETAFTFVFIAALLGVMFLMVSGGIRELKKRDDKMWADTSVQTTTSN